MSCGPCWVSTARHAVLVTGNRMFQLARSTQPPNAMKSSSGLLLCLDWFPALCLNADGFTHRIPYTCGWLASAAASRDMVRDLRQELRLHSKAPARRASQQTHFAGRHQHGSQCDAAGGTGAWPGQFWLPAAPLCTHSAASTHGPASPTPLHERRYPQSCRDT